MANILESVKAKLSLKGRFGQFNLTIFLILGASLLLCALAKRHPNPQVQLLGFIFTCGLILIVVIGAFYIYMRQAPRVSEETPIMEVKKGEVRFVNPPDSFYGREYFKNILLRTLLVGYDESLVPDGEVVGKVSEQNYRWYSKEEKQKFKEKYRAEVAGKREQIRKQLEIGDIIQSKDTRPSEDKKNTIKKGD